VNRSRRRRREEKKYDFRIGQYSIRLTTQVEGE
jgi:hypothetical protein